MILLKRLRNEALVFFILSHSGSDPPEEGPSNPLPNFGPGRTDFR